MDMIYMCIKDALDLVCHENCCYFFSSSDKLKKNRA